MPASSPLRDYKGFTPAVTMLKPVLVSRRSCPQPVAAPVLTPPGTPQPAAELRDVQINEVSSSSAVRRPPASGGGDTDSDAENRAAPCRPARRRSAPASAAAAALSASEPARRLPTDLLEKVRRKTDEWSQQARQLRSSLVTPPRTRRSALRSHNGESPAPVAGRKRRSLHAGSTHPPTKKPLTRSRIRLGK